MKTEINLNTILLLFGFMGVILYLHFSPSPGSSVLIKAQQDSIRVWQDSVLSAESRIVELQIKYATDSINYINDSIIAEAAYQKLLRAKGNTSQITSKHEAKRINIISLDADESIRLHARRKAIIDSLRLRIRSHQ